MKYIAILGRQPQVSMAELVSLYGDAVQFLNFDLAIVDGEIDLKRLGGTQKVAEIIAEFPHAKLDEALQKLRGPELLAKLIRRSDKKLAIGISVYGQKVLIRELFRTGLELKKLLRAQGQAVRIIEGKGASLSTAQVLHNAMTTGGAEIVIATGQNKTLIGVTREIQDIEAYSKRDHGRPARSAKIGMLPPKLAQIMINLASPAADSVVLDPFCGTGVVLQEAALMGYQAYGSDIEASTVEMARINMDWLEQPVTLETTDATTHTWKAPIGGVVTEGYLGPTLEREPDEAQLKTLRRDASLLTLAFLRNLRPQLESGTPVCITLPAWKQGSRYARLEIIDQIESLGYTLKQFFPVLQGDLLYHRPDQIVGRELVSLRST
jgi:tRNA (guanine10-N2)-dimethyltransferase